MRIRTIVLMLSMLAALAVPVMAQPATGEAFELIADRLVENQLKDGANAGSWGGETEFTGTIAIGLALAYKRTCDPAYKDAAEFAFDYIEVIAGGSYLGDEAYAMALLSSISDNPAENRYRTELHEFYVQENTSEGGTPGFIAFYADGTGPSTAVVLLSMHTMAAYYVDAEDKAMFRQALIAKLSQIDDDVAADEEYNWPVAALGIATWALAQTGPMDATLIDPSSTGEVIWQLKTLADLPTILVSHQSIHPGVSGSFYWRFDHTDGSGGSNSPANGFTEDTVFGVLGLAASSQLSEAIAGAKAALLTGVNPDGSVYGHIIEDSPDKAAYAAETLLALDALITAGDINLDDSVDVADLNVLASNWLSTCNADCQCKMADLSGDGKVNLIDFAIMASNWLD